jgi:hypothetical protein
LFSGDKQRFPRKTQVSMNIKEKNTNCYSSTLKHAILIKRYHEENDKNLRLKNYSQYLV